MPRDYGSSHASGLFKSKPAADQLDERMAAALQDRLPLEPLWRGIARLVAPRRGRLSGTNHKSKQGRQNALTAHHSIYNETGLLARRILSAGLMSGITSPSRPWFELSFEDQDLADFGPHKQWLRTVRDRMLTVFRVSNFYSAMYSVYNEMGPFGTSCAIIDHHFENVINVNVMTVGRYCLVGDQYNQATTMLRELELSVYQLYDMFYNVLGGDRKFPNGVRQAYDNGNYNDLFTLRHVIQPRTDFHKQAIGPAGMPVQSAYWFEDRNKLEGGNGLLFDTGYQESALVASRWDTVDNDVYGAGFPGEDALGPVRQSQHMEKAIGAALQILLQPPTLMPVSLRKGGGTPGPNQVIWYNSNEQVAQARSLYKDPPRVNEYMDDRANLNERVYQCFYADVITAIAAARRQSGREMTATEVAEIVGEKLLMLGPVLERMQVELIEPCIERTMAVMIRANLIPPAPPAIQGQPIKINHISTLAQAQRAVATGAVDRSLVAAERIVAMNGNPAVLDVLDQDEILRSYWVNQGTDPNNLRDKEAVDQIRRQRQEELAAEQQMAQAQVAAQTAESAAKVPTQGGESNLVADLAGL